VDGLLGGLLGGLWELTKEFVEAMSSPLGMEMRRTSVGVNGAMVEESWSRRLKAKRCGIFLRVVWLWEGKFLLHAGVWEEKEEERERRDV